MTMKWLSGYDAVIRILEVSMISKISTKKSMELKIQKKSLKKVRLPQFYFLNLANSRKKTSVRRWMSQWMSEWVRKSTKNRSKPKKNIWFERDCSKFTFHKPPKRCSYTGVKILGYWRGVEISLRRRWRPACEVMLGSQKYVTARLRYRQGYVIGKVTIGQIQVVKLD